MNQLLSSALFFTVLATTALANTQLADIRPPAGQVQKGSEQVTLLLKAKQPDAQAVRERISAMGGDIENLQRLVVELTQANPQFVQRRDKDWDLLRMQVQRLSTFHNTRDELMKADDTKKSRSALGAYAKGLAGRAELLKETAQRLQRESAKDARAASGKHQVARASTSSLTVRWVSIGLESNLESAHFRKMLTAATVGRSTCVSSPPAKDLGVSTVADRHRLALHARFVDEAICIGPARSAEIYLNIAAVISSTAITNVDVIPSGLLRHTSDRCPASSACHGRGRLRS